MSYFDPFDPNVRDRRKRRTKAQIKADKDGWNCRIDDAFKRVLEAMDWPPYVQSTFLLEDATPFHNSYCTLRKNMTGSMERLGYKLLANPNSKDGRWKAMGKSLNVYRKSCTFINSVNVGLPAYN